LWRELELLVASGMSPEQALRSATSAAADFLERPELGRLRRGAVADLICVRGNPLRGIPALPELKWVVQSGVAHRPSELLESAEIADETWRQDPWGRQFAWHWDRRK
jgi:cytosine/adenosine deaminase-related metal-dependent hydrolase